MRSRLCNLLSELQEPSICKPCYLLTYQAKLHRISHSPFHFHPATRTLTHTLPKRPHTRTHTQTHPYTPRTCTHLTRTHIDMYIHAHKYTPRTHTHHAPHTCPRTARRHPAHPQQNRVRGGRRTWHAGIGAPLEVAARRGDGSLVGECPCQCIRRKQRSLTPLDRIASLLGRVRQG